MKMKHYTTAVLTALLSIVIISAAAHGGVYWESIQVTGGMPSNLPKNLPEPVRKQLMAQFQNKEKVTKHYLTTYGSRMETEEETTIVLFDTMTVYQINPANQTYMKLKMSDMQDAMGPEGQDMAKDMKIVETGETQVINGYRCRKYIVKVMGVDSEQWLSKEVPAYDEYERINKKLMANKAEFTIPGMSGELSGKGFPVKTVSSVMGVNTTTTLNKIEERSIDKGMFEIPSGYTEKPFALPKR